MSRAPIIALPPFFSILDLIDCASLSVSALYETTLYLKVLVGRIPIFLIALFLSSSELKFPCTRTASSITVPTISFISFFK